MKIATETIGWVVSAVGVFPQIAGGFLNLTKNATAKKNINHIGYPESILTGFGVWVILIAVLTLVPATSFLGVILETAWMGGAIAAHVRVKDNYVLQLIIPIIVWVGFGLRHQPEMHRLFGF
jgi:hypothetical protein